MEAGWSDRRVAHQLGRSDYVVRRCWNQWIREIIYTKTRLRMPSTEQSSRRPPHRKKCTRTANCFNGRHPGTAIDAFVWSGATHEETGLCAAEFNQVVFSVVCVCESRFNLSSDDNRVRVWRSRGECRNPVFALS
ncbi:uncharacterized protein TNCV_2458081 [Trichonephila clavipes]|nr:uncharacterized protein TNCV_2458081 [Trichonephila clavipes]